MTPAPFWQPISDFIFVEDEPQEADIIFVPGGAYPQIAKRAASLWKEGYAKIILPSGSHSKLKDDPGVSEWSLFKDVLLAEGVPEECIWKEDRATFTWENAIYSRRVTDAHSLEVKKALLVCQAYHARRALTYYQQQFPETFFFVCPVVTMDITKENWFLDQNKTKIVLEEVTRCGRQFTCMLPPGDPIGWHGGNDPTGGA